MATTPTQAIPYGGPNDAPDVPYWMQRLAERVAALLDAVGLRLDSLEKNRVAEFSGPIVGFTAGQTQTFGALAEAPAPGTSNNDFVVPAGPGQLKITKAGVYTIAALTLPSSGVMHNLRIKRISVAGNASGTAWAGAKGGDYGDQNLSASTTRYVAADTIFEMTVLMSGANTIGTNVTVTKH